MNMFQVIEMLNLPDVEQTGVPSAPTIEPVNRTEPRIAP